MSCHRIEFSRACTILALFGLALKTAPVATHAADDGPVTRSATRDWLIDGSSFEAAVRPGRDSDELVLENGLIRRTFRLAPNGATVGLDNLVTGEALLRGVKPEALITIVVVPPLHRIVPALADPTSGVGSVIVPLTVVVQPFASVTR